MILEVSASETWPLRHSVMWPDKPLDYVKLPEDEQGIHYGLYKSEELISVVSLFVEGNKAQFRKFATIVSQQGNGYGTELLSYLFSQLNSLGVEKVWCNARIDKTSFYHRFSMKETAHSFIKSGQSYVVMEKIISESSQTS